MILLSKRVRCSLLPFLWNYYSVHIIIPQNTESGEPEIKNIGEKFQDKNELIIRNNLISERGKQNTDIIQ